MSNVTVDITENITQVTATINETTQSVAVEVTTSGAQPTNANLTALSNLTGAADKVPYFTGVGAMALATLTSYGRSILALADRAGLLTLLGLTTADVPQDSTHRMVSDTQINTWDAKQSALGYIPANVASNLSDLASASAARTNLGLGTLATQNGTFSGTSSGTNTGDETGARIATLAHAATAKTTLVDADEIAGTDSASSYSLIRTTMANVWAYITAKLPSILSTASKESPALGSELTGSSGWTSTNWTGSYGAGFTHTAGNTSALSYTVAALAANTQYAISFTISGRTAGQVDIAMGGFGTTGGDGHKYPDAADGSYPTTNYQIGVYTADSTTPLTFTPTSTFNGTISNISVKSITAATASTIGITNSASNVVYETRSNGANNGGTFAGYLAGAYNLASGLYNTAFGNKALWSNLGGSQNTAVGYSALQLNTAGRSNTAVGANALQANTNGGQNTAVGYGSLIVNTTGFNNVSVGVESLKSNTTGSYNVSVGGYDTMYYNVTGSNNTAVGMLALQNSTVSNLTAIGSNALQANTTGLTNTGVGFYALNTNQTGAANTALGYQAGYTVKTSDNTMIGKNTGFSASTGTGSNTAVGSSALFTLTTAGYGTAVGAFSLNLATGRGNTAVGTWSAKNLSTGKANIALGSFIDLPSNTADGQINIGGVIFGLGAYDGGGTGTNSSAAQAGSMVAVGTRAPTSTLQSGGSFAKNIPTTVTNATYSLLATDAHIIANRAGTVTLTLPTASTCPGREITLRTIQSQTVVSNASDVVPIAGGTAGTAILSATAGKWALLVSDGSAWQMQMAG
jgi:hypothetical protein